MIKNDIRVSSQVKCDALKVGRVVSRSQSVRARRHFRVIWGYQIWDATWWRRYERIYLKLMRDNQNYNDNDNDHVNVKGYGDGATGSTTTTEDDNEPGRICSRNDDYKDNTTTTTTFINHTSTCLLH